MLRLNPADLRRLEGGGGAPFAHFVDRLIRNEAARGGLPQAEIATQLRVNVRDGGVDTEVKSAIPRDGTGWFAVPTCWQFKALEAAEIDDKKKKTKQNELQAEINKPYAAELLKNGYGYRLCILGDLAPPKLAEWEAQLKAEANKLNPDAPDPRVVHGGHLLQWAERFPGVVAWLRNLTHGGVFHWDAWAANRRAVTPTYVPNADWNDVHLRIREHANFEAPCVGGDPCLYVGGAAGVGKTRLVFETLLELLQSPGMVIIVDDEQEARKLGTWLANEPGQSAILVVDESSSHTRYFLNENLRGHVDRVRVISIDNAGEPLASASGRIMLSAADALKNAGGILAANFPAVSPERRSQYARLSRGFIRLAADMCNHDPELRAGEIGGILGDVERYARHRLGDNLRVICALALFDKVGFRDDVVGEIDLLCTLTGHSKQQFVDAVRTTRESPGFVAQAGRYWYVTPEIMAQVLFNEAWERWVAPDLAAFTKQLPPAMLQQLLGRVATHARREVGDAVRKFFRGWFNNLTASDLADPQIVSLATTLVEIAPEEFLPLLRLAVEGAPASALSKIKSHVFGHRWGPRRTLVWLLERLVSFPEYFDDCEAALFRLSLEESEPQIGNNATAIWTNLFDVALSGTATPFDRRLTVLEKRTGSSAVPEARLAFAALARALQRPEGRPGGELLVDGRPRPKDWQATTVMEERACYRGALELCGKWLREGTGENHRSAFSVLADSVYFLLFCGLADDLCRIVTPAHVTEDEARTLLQRIDQFLQHQRERLNQAARTDDQAATYVQRVVAWSNFFRPTDFIGRLRSICAPPPWHQLATKNADEVEEIASLLVRQPAVLSGQLDWLASPEAQSAERLGFAVGRADHDGQCGRMIFEHAIERGAPSFLRGYLRGMVAAQRAPRPGLLALMDRLEIAHPQLAVDVLGCAGDDFDALNRILRLIDSEAVSIRYLAALAMGLGSRALRMDELDRLLPYFVRAAENREAGAAHSGVRFLATYLHFEPSHSQQRCLESPVTRSLAWQLADAALPLLAGDAAFEWLEMLKTLAAFEPEHAARSLGHALLSEDGALRDRAAMELAELAKSVPEDVMAAFGSALLDPTHGWLLQVSVYRDLVAELPPDVVFSWLREKGIAGARAVARHLPLPRLDDSGNPVVPQVLDVVLKEFDDQKVFGNFLSGSHSGEVWWGGGGGDEFRRTAERAKMFVNYPNRRIQEWAKEEMGHRLRMAEWEDQDFEERALPS